MGYPEGVKGYRLWCLEPGHKKCIVNRDVTFNELEMANLTKKWSSDTTVKVLLKQKLR